jgi:hypothetical protein
MAGLRAGGVALHDDSHLGQSYNFCGKTLLLSVEFAQPVAGLDLQPERQQPCRLWPAWIGVSSALASKFNAKRHTNV